MNIDWKATLAVVAPTLATALGGPMAGVAVSAAAKALGLDSGATEEDLKNAVLGADPDTLYKLKVAEQDFKVEMRKLDITLEELHAGDRDSARKLAIAKGVEPQVVLSAIFIGGFFIVLYSLLGGKITIPEDIKDAVLPLIGILTSSVLMITNFWFGSSRGSKDKTAELVAAIHGKGIK